MANTSDSPDSVRPATHLGRQLILGVTCGLAAAMGYVASNIGLRYAAHVDPFWVSAVKAFPTAVATLPFAFLWFWRAANPKDWGAMGWMLSAAVVAQLGGNVLFQHALSVTGLAISVPVNLASNIISGALLGRFVLKEPFTKRTAIAVTILITAVSILSVASHPSPTSRVTLTNLQVSPEVILATLGNILSGFSYGYLGAMIRLVLRRGLPVPVAMCISGVVGVSLLTSISCYRVGMNTMLQTDAQGWIGMLCGGVFNAIAFFLLAQSLRRIPVVAVNLLNATQAAFTTIAGWLLFSEPFTFPLIIGVTLTIWALTLLGVPKNRHQLRSP